MNRAIQITYFLLRIVAGLLFACHGAQKLFGFLGAERATGAFMTLAGVIEFFGGLFVALGLFASIAAFICSGQMAVAYFKAHAPGGFWPIQNHGELAMIYCFLFFYIAARGPGMWSLGRGRRGRPAAP